MCKYLMYITSSATNNMRTLIKHTFQAGHRNQYIIRLTSSKEEFTKQDLVNYINKLRFIYKTYKEDMKKEWFYPRILATEGKIENAARAIMAIESIIHFHLVEDDRIILEYVSQDDFLL